MDHAAEVAKKKHKSDVAADKKAGEDCTTVKLNLAAGEEVTGLTKDEMTSVCDKLEQFARKNPHRVEAAGGGGGGGRERK